MLKRPKHIEGWAIDVPDAEKDTDSSGIINRVLENSKVWIICFIIVVMGTGFLVYNENRASQPKMAQMPPSVNPNVDFRNKSHRDFSREFMETETLKTVVMEAEFTGPDTFRIVLVSTVTADEIEYIAKFAAEKIRYKFGHRSVVNVYLRKIDGSKEVLAATARWKKDKHGYMVDFVKDYSKQL